VICGLAVAAFLFVCRLGIVFYDRAPWDRGIWALTREAIRYFGMDAVAVSIVTGLAITIARRWVVAASTLFMTAAAYLLVLGAANVRVVSVYRQPATLNLLQYGDFLDLGHARSLTEYMTEVDYMLLVGAVICALSLFGARWIQRSRFFDWPAARWLVLACTVPVGLMWPAHALLRDDERTRRHHANAGWWMIRSIVAPATPLAPEVADPDLAAPFETYAADKSKRITTPARVREARIRNVLIIVLESVGSEYLDLRNNPRLTPNLARVMPGAAYFPNAYAPIPASTMSLFALATGMYPPVTPEAIPIAEPHYPAATLFEVFRDGGKRGAIFTSSWTFMDFDAFLEARGVDRIVQSNDDCRGTAAPESARWGRADDCSVSELKHWVGQSDRDFFALLWTRRTHYPYGVDRAQLAANRALGLPSYLDQITSTDGLVGELLAWLEERGKLDRTLVVVVGDHGQAFYQHNNQGHGNDVYRETAVVPLMFINKRLFSGVTDATPVSLIDVAPTVLSLAGETAPSTVQGVDLSAPLRSRRVFYAAVWSNHVMGFQESRMKYNYSNETGKLEIFDLARDPGEEADLALEVRGEERARIVYRIMNWKAAVAAKIVAGRVAPDAR
jgi:hypothetical protein